MIKNTDSREIDYSVGSVIGVYHGNPSVNAQKPCKAYTCIAATLRQEAEKKNHPQNLGCVRAN